MGREADFVFQGTFGEIWKHFSLSLLEGAPDIQWVKAWVPAKPKSQNSSPQKMIWPEMSVVPRFRVIDSKECV